MYRLVNIQFSDGAMFNIQTRSFSVRHRQQTSRFFQTTLRNWVETKHLSITASVCLQRIWIDLWLIRATTLVTKEQPDGKFEKMHKWLFVIETRRNCSYKREQTKYANWKKLYVQKIIIHMFFDKKNSWSLYR